MANKKFVVKLSREEHERDPQGQSLGKDYAESTHPAEGGSG
jgi:hypothetical protein